MWQRHCTTLRIFTPDVTDFMLCVTVLLHASFCLSLFFTVLFLCFYCSIGSPAIWDHTVLPATRHRWTRPALTPASKVVLDLPTPTPNQHASTSDLLAVRRLAVGRWRHRGLSTEVADRLYNSRRPQCVVERLGAWVAVLLVLQPVQPLVMWTMLPPLPPSRLPSSRRRTKTRRYCVSDGDGPLCHFPFCRFPSRRFPLPNPKANP